MRGIIVVLSGNGYFGRAGERRRGGREGKVGKVGKVQKVGGKEQEGREVMGVGGVLLAAGGCGMIGRDRSLHLVALLLPICYEVYES